VAHEHRNNGSDRNRSERFIVSDSGRDLCLYHMIHLSVMDDLSGHDPRVRCLNLVLANVAFVYGVHAEGGE
jgi:hypothetical protein